MTRIRLKLSTCGAIAALWWGSAAAANPPKADGDPALVQTLGVLLDDPAVRQARVSVVIVEADSGKIAFAMHPDLTLHPASNTKLVTTAAALDRLGPSYRFTTELAVDNLDAGVARDVYLIGRGDPRFVSEALWKLVDDARRRGLVEVTGDVVIDDTWFTPERIAPGFADKDQDAAYRAPSGATSFNFNSIAIHIRPADLVGQPPRVEVSPDSGYAVLENRATTVTRGRERITVSARAFEDRTRITVGGRIPHHHPGLTARRRIDNPSLFTGLAVKLFLERAGIAVGGNVRIEVAPKARKRLARHFSPPLGQLVADVNKLSNNFMAEQILRTLGAVDSGSGSWVAGREAVRHFLVDVAGVRGKFRYDNGSGLYGSTAFSARQIVDLLRAMRSRVPALPEYAASLAIGGTDGTLRRRTRNLDAGRLRAKTGTLSGVICLSGYTYFADDRTAVFSFLMNDVPGKPWAVWQVHDAMIAAINRHTPTTAKDGNPPVRR